MELVRRNEGQGYDCHAWITHDKPTVVLVAKQDAGPLDRLIVGLECIPQCVRWGEPTPEQVQAKIICLDAELVRRRAEADDIVRRMIRCMQIIENTQGRTRHATPNMSAATAEQ
jgi:hypothetical protein